MVNQFSLYFMQSFSVLLSLYHKESALFLHQSLESVFAQTLLPTEVILVEDGPLSEELHAVVKEFQSLQGRGTESLVGFKGKALNFSCP